jgi:Fe-S cluster assembly protein SufD
LTLIETATKSTTTQSEVRGFTREALDALIASRDEPAWMRDRRLEAWRVLQDTPYPTTSDEAWRRTDIRSLKLSDFNAVGKPPIAATRQGTMDKALKGVPSDWKRALKDDDISGALLSVDGVKAGAMMSDELRSSGVILTDMDTALREHSEQVDQYFMTRAVKFNDDYFAALHGAFWRGGTFLYVPRGVEVKLPLRSFTWLGQSDYSAPHTLVVMEPGSRAVLIDEYASSKADSPAFNAGVVELFLNDGAQLDYVGIQDWGRGLWNLTNERALVSRDATLHWIIGGLGSKLTKTFLDAQLIGQGGTALLSGVFFADGTQHLDLDTEQNHQAPHCKSDLLYKGALKDSARTVWQGMIRVAKSAQKTDGYQANRNLLLSDKARADSIPGLEIQADDVRCTHGSTVSRMDEEEIFYLMSRGISRLESEALLVNAFFTPVLDRIPLTSVRERLKKEIAKKMNNGS